MSREIVYFFRDCLLTFISNVIQLNRQVDCSELVLFKTWLKYWATTPQLLIILESILESKEKIMNSELDYFADLPEFRNYLSSFISSERLDYLVENVWKKASPSEKLAICQWAQKLVMVISAPNEFEFNKEAPAQPA